MDEGTKRRWDIRLGIVAPLLTVVAILVGVWQFIEGQQNTTRLEYNLLAKQSAIDFERRLWIEQLETYDEIAKTAGAIAAYYDSPDRLNELTGEFLSLYWGAMILVEDDSVEDAMITFYLEVQDYRDGWSDGQPP